MAGHSKWANIKHRKGAQDARRSKIFQKLAKEITIAAKGGADPANNPSLRLMLAKARSSNMPKDKIENAINKGSGVYRDDVQYQELIYEASGSNGAFLIIEALTDKPTRTSPVLRSVLKKYGWTIAPTHSAMYAFQRQGRIVLEKAKIPIEKMEEIVLETCATDFQVEDEVYFIYSESNQINQLKDDLEKQGVEDLLEIEVGFFANITAELDEEHFASLEKLIEALEDEDDVSQVFHNVTKA